MMPPAPRKGSRPSFVSHLQVKRLHQELASAHQRLEEYEDLIASLYDALDTTQSLACDQCRANFEQFAPASFAASMASNRPPSNSALHQPQYDHLSDSGESYRSHMLSGSRAQTNPHSRNPSASSLVDRRSQWSASPSSNIGSISYENDTSWASNRDSDGQHPIYLQAPSISSRSSSYESNRDTKYLHAPSISSRPSFASDYYEIQPPHIAKPVLLITDEPDPSVGWSISFNKNVKPSINVKLVDVLAFEEVVPCVKFSPDGKYLAVGLDDGQTYIHNVKLGKKDCILTELSLTNVPPKRDRLWVMNFSPDSKYLVTGNQSFIIRIWDIAKRRVRNIFRHEAGVSGVDFSSDGRILVSAAHDGTIRAWSMRDGSCRIYSETDASYYSLRVTPDGRHIAAMDYDGKMRIVNFRTGEQVEWKAHDGPATLSIMPNGKGLVTGGWDKTIKYWNLGFLRETQSGTLKLPETLKFTGHKSVVRGVTILADGKWIISISEDLTVCIWDSRTASRQCILNGHDKDIWWVDASPAGSYFASGGNDRRVAIWRCDPI